MKLWKKVLSTLTSLMLICNLIQWMPSVKAADLDSYIAQLIMYYQTYQDAAQSDIDRIIEEMATINEEEANAWEEIMDYWSSVNQEGFTNIGVVPEGLPNDDSLAVVILGFALNDDGTMKEELIGRLQTGLDIANAYPNSYVVVTGGGTAANNPNVTEGGLMGDWLLEQGLSESRLIVENRAPDTVGNAENTYAILNEQYPSVDSIVLVTSDYHVPRGCLLYNSKFVLEAYENNSEPLTIVSNAGYNTGTEGYETIALQGNGLRSVAGISSKPTVTLSTLQAIKVVQNTPYTLGAELDLSVKAIYSSGYEKDVTEQISITNFDATLDENQTITISYSEGEVTITGELPLNVLTKEYVDKVSLQALVDEAEAINADEYLESSYTYFLSVVDEAKEALQNEQLTLVQFHQIYDKLKDVKETLRKRINLVPYAVITSNDTGSDKISKIQDKKNDTYWTSSNPGIADLEILIELNGYYFLDEINVRPYHSTKSSDNTVRSYFYDVYVSHDNVEWTLVASHTETGTKDAGNSHPVDVDFSVKYIKIDGTGKVNPGNQTNQFFHLSEVYAYGEEEGNILVGKTFNSSGEDTSVSSSATATTDKALDGDPSTYWDAGAHVNSPWIEIDLEKVYRLDAVNVINYISSSRFYQHEVYVSMDGEKYVCVGGKSDEEVSLAIGSTLAFEDIICARYLRIVGTYNSSNSAYHIAEIRAYGEEATQEEIVTSELNLEKKELESFIGNVYRSDYIPSAWPAYEQARQEAYDLLASEDVTIDAINAMQASLEALVATMEKGNPDEKAEGTFRLASFNIWAPNPVHPDVEAINAELLRVEADYVGMQEVDRNNTRDPRDVIALVADDDYSYNYQKSIDYKSGEYGIGQLSSTEMKEVSGANFTQINGEEKRSWMRMLVEVDGQEVAIYNVHLSVDDAAINSNINELLEVLANDPVPYKLVTGDYNATREMMDPFKETYNLANGNDGLWYSTFEGDKYSAGAGYLDGKPNADITSGIDNIVYTRNIQMENFRVVHNDGLSDHFMIYGDFRLLTYDEDLQAYVSEHTYTLDDVLPTNFEAYTTALETANTLLANENVVSMQAECKAALEALTTAVNALTLKPTKVNGLVAEEVDYKNIQLSWEAVADATSYVVERFNTTTNEWMFVADTSETTYTHAGVKTGKQYTYRVKAITKVEDDVYEGAYSDEVSATTTLQGTLTLELTNNGPVQFDLTWNQIDGATRYIVYRKSTNNEYKKLVTLGKDVTTYTTRAMTADTYTYQVKAARYDSVERVFGATSNEVQGTIENTTAPTLNKEVKEDHKLQLTWNKVARMNAYELYQSTNDGTYRLLTRTKANTYETKPCKVGSTYRYKVRGYALVNNAKVYTPFSEVVEYVAQ